MRSIRITSFVLATVCIVASACDDTNPLEPTGTPGIHALRGAAVTDTIDAQIPQALVVEVRGENGEVASGLVVRFESRPPADSLRRSELAVNVCALTAAVCGTPGSSAFRADTTDGRGQVSALVRLGSVAGRAVVRISVPELGLVDSVTYMVLPGAVARVRAPAADTGLNVGETITLRARVVDRYNNTRTDAVTTTLGVGNALSLNATTGAVTGIGMGTQYLYFRTATLSDSTAVRALPGGRLVVWSNGSNSVRMVDLSGRNTRTLLTGLSSDFGVFPQFDVTGQRVTLHANTSGSGSPNAAIVVDTSGGGRRDIGNTAGLSSVIAARGLADGTVAIVARRASDPAGYFLFRAALDNSLTLVGALPGFTPGDIAYGGADISHDGTRVVYLNGPEVRILNVVTGNVTVLAGNGRAPRWSPTDDRVAYLATTSGFDGTMVIINADGTNRRPLGNTVFSPGLAWSPDGKYVIGRSSLVPLPTLVVVQVSDAATVALRTATAGLADDYFQPDWR